MRSVRVTLGVQVKYTRVKICGFTRLQDALIAQDLGADALGFVFVPQSARCIGVDSAAQIIESLSPFITPVGLFLNANAQDVRRILSSIPALVPQFHGQETAEYCDQFKRPYIKAMGVANGMPGESELKAYARCVGFLFDSNVPGALGGTGHTFDWSTVEKNLPKPMILAGGLNVDNVGSAIQQLAPHAVDVSSGVEQAKGIKSAELMQAFMQMVREADEKYNSRQ